MGYAHCNALIKSAASTIAVAVPLSSLLMYFRIYVVYHDSPFVKTAFGVMWLGVVGASVCGPFSVQGVSIAGQCMPINVNSNGAAGITASAVYDSFIFFAISYRLLAFHSQIDSWKGRMKSFFHGEALFNTSKLLLQTGQLYYACVYITFSFVLKLRLRVGRQLASIF